MGRQDDLDLKKRIRLGLILCDLRRRTGISGRELARRTEIPQSHISKFENGKLAPSKEHLKQIAAALKLPSEERRRLSTWSRMLSYDFSPFLLHSDAQLAENQRLVSDIEGGCQVLRAFQCYLVPGLLQAPSYIRSVFEASKHGLEVVSDQTVDRAVNLRQHRQGILADTDKRFFFLLHEMALVQRLGTKKVMQEQIAHLIEINGSGIADIALIPANSYWRGELPTTSFDIFDSELVLTETRAGLLYLWMEDVIERYLRMFDSMWLQGVTGVRLEAELTRILANL